MDVVVGVDLGGTKIAAAWVDRAGNTGSVLSTPTPALEGPERILDAVALLVSRAVPSDEVFDVQAVGVGTAGVVDVDTGTVVSSTDALAGWSGTHVAAGVADRIGRQTGQANLLVHVENDVNAHAAGEVWLGAAAGAARALMVAVGTGVGGAVVIDGVAIRGSHHVAGEVGHIPTPGAEGLRCPCGREGHLEAIAAGPAILRRYLAMGGGHCQDAQVVFERAHDGEPLAERMVAEAAVALGRALAGMATILDPDIILIGGGLSEAGSIWWEPMERALRQEVIPPLAGIRVVAATLGPKAAVLGAARGAWRRLGGGSAATGPATSAC